jgi:hypothetical protein
MALTRNYPLTVQILDSSAASVVTGQNGYVIAPIPGQDHPGWDVAWRRYHDR